jgi:CoA:oxalate CoA-transferase
MPCPAPLEGLRLSARAIGVAGRVCAEHLTRLGACPSETGEWARAGELAVWSEETGQDGVTCSIRWHPSDQDLPATEATIQAVSGLMGVHGREALRPRRLGLPVASVAAGVLATQGALAALIARSRGQPVTGVATTVLQAALMFLRHHVAIATCGDVFPHGMVVTAAGPPFYTADGYWVELEALSGDAWKEFWIRLGVGRSDAGGSWLPFAFRYLAGRCSLPDTLHQASRRVTLGHLRAVASETGVAVCRVRDRAEVVAELGPDGVGPPWLIDQGSWSPDRNGARQASGPGPLSGFRVVEVTSRLQGPLAGQLLRLLGAEVIKVEPPGGDFGRSAPPRAGSAGAAYLAYNSGKRVVEIDYKDGAGRAALADLLADADVFLHNWRSGRAEQLGLDPASVSRLNASLAYAHASGWGGLTVEPDPIAGDYLVQAHAACGEGLNSPDQPPFPSRVTLVDVTGGLLACEGILAALYLRERTGRSARVTTSLYAAALALQTGLLDGSSAARTLWGLWDEPLQTSDGFLVVSVEGRTALGQLAASCGLAPAEGELEERIAERLRSRPAAEWEGRLRAAGIAAAAVRRDLSVLPDDPALGCLLEPIDGCWVPGSPWQFTGRGQPPR